MPRWMRIARGMIGTGMVFSAGMGIASAVVGAVLSVFAEFRLIDVIVPAARFAVLGFPIGVAFSGLLALLARGRGAGSLTVGRFAGLGAVVGALALLLLASNSNGSWSEGDYVLGMLLLPGVGAAVAAASLLIARRSREPSDEGVAALGLPGDDPIALSGGSYVPPVSAKRSRDAVR